MKNQTGQNKSQTGGIIILVIGLAVIVFMVFLITPNLKNDTTAFTDIREYVGKDAFVEIIGEKLPPSVPSKDILEYKVVNSKGNVLEILSTYTTFDAISGEKIYENSNTYFIDRVTRKHISDKEYYFEFPINVKKQNYQLIDPNMEVPATFVFEGVKQVDDLEVYEFSCKSTGADFSDAWPEFSPEKIYADQTCKTEIEPVTGRTISFSITWNMYAIHDGDQITIERGESKTTQFTERILLQIAKNTKQLFYIYDIVIPTFIIIISIAIFFINRYNKSVKEKEKIIIKQLEVKQINESKIELLEKQSKQEKFSTIGELSARLSHDLRNPLSVIKMGVESIDGKYNKIFDEGDKNKIQRIKKAIDRISYQVENVLSFVRTNHVLVESSSMKAILASTLESLKIPNGIKIAVPKSDIEIFVDPLQMEVVLSNIITNSIQALGESGEIEIKLIEESGDIKIQIIDSGPGIPEKELPKIFEPLFTTKQKGTGLGLASCMTIIKNHGGMIGVKNNPTTFTITLPKNQKITET